MSLPSRRSAWARCAFFIVGLVLFVAVIDAALAQPFGVTRGAAPPEIGGFAGWILPSRPSSTACCRA